MVVVDILIKSRCSFSYLLFPVVIFLTFLIIYKFIEYIFLAELWLAQNPFGIVKISAVNFDNEYFVHDYDNFDLVKEIHPRNKWATVLGMLTYSFLMHPFSNLWKKSENRKVFCFQVVEKGCNGNKWFKAHSKHYILKANLETLLMISPNILLRTYVLQ